jgi:hypothetical protein
MMIVDPTRTWRSPFDGDLEKRLEDAYKESFPKLVSGSVSLIEAQDKILKHISDALVALKNGNRAKSHTRRKQTD